MEQGAPGSRRATDVKVVVLGESGVGKTSIVSQLAHKTFHEDVQTTIGAAFASADFSTGAAEYTLRLWDTAGQEKYHSLAPMYYRGAMAAVIVFDLTRAHTFRTVKHWVAELSVHGPRDIALAIVGNKSDLVESGVAAREVVETDAREFARSIGATYAEVSARAGDGIERLFAELCTNLPKQQQHGSPSTFITPHKMPQRTPTPTTGCCT